MNYNTRQSMTSVCDNLRGIKQSLSDAASTVENGTTKTRIESQLSAIETCLAECEGIRSGLSHQ